MQTDIKRNAIKSIIDRFEDKPKDTLNDIQVDHFSLNLKSFVLK